VGRKASCGALRGSFLPVAAMVVIVMVVVDSWSLGQTSTVEIAYNFYGINNFFGLYNWAGLNFIRPVRT